MLAVATLIAAALTDRLQTPGSAIRHNNFCAFRCDVLSQNLRFFYYKRLQIMACNFPSNLFSEITQTTQFISYLRGFGVLGFWG